MARQILTAAGQADQDRRDRPFRRACLQSRRRPRDQIGRTGARLGRLHAKPDGPAAQLYDRDRNGQPQRLFRRARPDRVDGSHRCRCVILTQSPLLLVFPAKAGIQRLQGRSGCPLFKPGAGLYALFMFVPLLRSRRVWFNHRLSILLVAGRVLAKGSISPLSSLLGKRGSEAGRRRRSSTYPPAVLADCAAA